MKLGSSGYPVSETGGCTPIERCTERMGAGDLKALNGARPYLVKTMDGRIPGH